MNNYPPHAALLFMIQTLVCQLVAVATSIITWSILPSSSAVVVSASIVALMGAQLLRLSPPWVLLNGALPLGAALSLSVQISQWFFFLPFTTLLCIYAPALWTRVPYYPTPKAAYSLILAELPLDRPFAFVDIGCGCGDLLLFLSKHRPHGTFIGLEIGVLPWIVGSVKAWLYGRGRISIRFRSLWHEPLDQYDVVYTFLSPAPMPDIWRKAASEMRPGTLFITNSFPVPAQADEVIAVKDFRKSQLYLHRMGTPHDVRAIG